MNKKFLMLLLCVLFTVAVLAANYEIAVVVKIGGIPWFNRMEVGVKDAASELGVNAYSDRAFRCRSCSAGEDY